MIMNDFFDEGDYIAYRYEAWLSPRAVRADEGDNIDIFFYRGRNMQPYDLPQNENLLVYAITPRGKKQDIEMSRSTKNSYIYNIKLEEKGLYHFIGQKTGYYSVDAEGNYLSGSFEDNPNAVSATRYLQYAHTALPAGENLDSKDYNEAPSLPLRIVPDKWDGFGTGEVFSFTLFFGDRLLPLFEVEIEHSQGKSGATREKLLTDGNGRISFPLNTSGKYLVLAGYTALETKDGLYYDTKYTYTFCFKAEA